MEYSSPVIPRKQNHNDISNHNLSDVKESEQAADSLSTKVSTLPFHFLNGRISQEEITSRTSSVLVLQLRSFNQVGK